MARHLRILNRKLVEASAGSARLMVCMPPRHGKSMLTSQYFPAWYLGTFPDKRVILASYEADFAASWGRKVRDVLDRNGHSFGVKLRPDSKAANRWDIDGHLGGMMTAGVGGPLTGKGADLLIIDDPFKNAEDSYSPTIRQKVWEWYQSTAYTRLEPNGSVVLINTRWNRDDLSGRLLEQSGKEDGEEWDVLRMPALAEEVDSLGRKVGEALWPERFSVARLHKMRAAMEAYWWACLYQQTPRPEGGTEWPDSYFPPSIWFDQWPSDLPVKVMHLDPSKGKDAKHGDYSAFVELGIDTSGILWVDGNLERRPTPQIVEDGMRLYREFGPHAFSIEINSFQELLGVEFLRVAKERGVTLPMYGMNNSTNKQVRIRTLGPYLARGEMRFRNTPGSRLLVQQMRDFPLGEHDDGPDALEGALRMLWWMLGRREGSGQPTILLA